MQNPFRWPYKPLASPEKWPRLTGVGVVFPDAPDGARAHGRWVIARSLCRFRHFALPAAAGTQRRAVLRNLLLAWAPFDDAAYSVVLRADGATAWAWDRPRSTAALTAADAPAGAALIPETLLRAPAVRDGLRLVDSLEGVEGQAWLHGQLLASRWWPERPDAAAWARWATAAAAQAGIEVSADETPLQALPWQRPWADGLSFEALQSSSSRLERIAIGAALTGLVGLSSAQVHQVWDAWQGQQALRGERDRIAAAAAPVIGARDRALALAAEAEALSGQLAAPLPLEVLQHLSERLPPLGAVLKELDLEGSRLRIALEVAPGLPRASIVKDLQASGWFTRVAEVRDASGRGWLGFEMQLQGLRAPASPAAPEASLAVPPGAFPGAPPGATPLRPFPASAPRVPGFPGMPT